MSNIGFNCDVCGRTVQGCTFVNGMKFCAKCYYETFGKDYSQIDIKINAQYTEHLAKENAQLKEKFENLEQENKQLKEQLAKKDKEINKLQQMAIMDMQTKEILELQVATIRKQVCENIREKLQMNKYNTCEHTAFGVYYDGLKEILDQIEQGEQQ